MINIRKNLFETNSSSVHALVIPKNQNIEIPRKVNLRYSFYDWEFEKKEDTIDYLYTACKDNGINWVNKLLNYLKKKGVQEINIIDDSNKYAYYGVNHYDCVPLKELFDNEDLLDRFLFGSESYVQTGNDNVFGDEDEYEICPSDMKFDDNVDVLFKFN